VCLNRDLNPLRLPSDGCFRPPADAVPSTLGGEHCLGLWAELCGIAGVWNYAEVCLNRDLNPLRLPSDGWDSESHPHNVAKEAEAGGRGRASQERGPAQIRYKYALSKQADKAEQAARKLAAKEEQGDATREEVATAEADARVARARAHTGTGAHHRFQRNACRITIKALLDGLTRFYNPGPFAASSAAASSLPSSADAAASSSTARHLG